MEEVTMMEQTPVFQTVEVCTRCGKENVFLYWDAKKHGYETTCCRCGNTLMLCEECINAEDNRGGRCDWKDGSCFRKQGTMREGGNEYGVDKCGG